MAIHTQKAYSNKKKIPRFHQDTKNQPEKSLEIKENNVYEQLIETKKNNIAE